MEDQRQFVLKALTLGSDDTVSNVLQEVDETDRRFGEAGAIEPPYSPIGLIRMLEHSNSLRQNVDSYATNIDGFGHRFEPVIDLDCIDADQRIAHAIYLERLAARQDQNAATAVLDLPLNPTELEVEQRREKLVAEMRIERSELEQFFQFCCEDISFVTLRRRIRQDLEITGNAFMEVLRDGTGKVAEFVYVPAFTMRLLPLDCTTTEITVNVKVSELAFGKLHRRRRFRRFVQVFEGAVVYFKEFGDPRRISRKTGKVMANGSWEKDDGPATELIHFKVHSPRSAYGVPRWIGNLLAVLGSRSSEEVNYLYFDNKSVPPLALLVSGGHVTDETVSRIESFIDQEIKGKKNFHKILVLEGEGTGGSFDQSSRMQMNLQPLTDAQQADALFQQYDANNQDKVGMSFRLPRLLRGDVRDFNRSTAEAALDFAEQQVFSPERAEFDYLMNRKILSDMGVKFWRFRSNAPTVKDSKQLAEIIKDLALAGVLTPEEGRQLAEGVFNRELARIEEGWVKQPLSLTLAGLPWTGTPVITPYTGEPLGVGQDRAEYGDLDADGLPDQQEMQDAIDLPVPVVTPTALSNVLTVNEVRQSHGFGPKTLADGSHDPSGDLTVAEYVEQARTKKPEQLNRGAGRNVLAEAQRLVALRNALVDMEAKRATARFYAAKRAELEEDGVSLPPAVWRDIAERDG